jgi:hypothetical protein
VIPLGRACRCGHPHAEWESLRTPKQHRPANESHSGDLAKEVQPPDKGVLSRTLFNDGRLKAVLFGFDRGEELSPSTRSISPPNGASHQPLLNVSESLRVVYPGTVRGSFETPGLRLDEDHDVRILMGQFLLGQLEARFSLFR